MLAFFGPTAVLTFIVGGLWNKLEKWPWRRSIQQGLAPPSAYCLQVASPWRREPFRGLETATIAVLVLLLLLNYKINPSLLILAGAVIGVLAFTP